MGGGGGWRLGEGVWSLEEGPRGGGGQAYMFQVSQQACSKLLAKLSSLNSQYCKLVQALGQYVERPFLYQLIGNSELFLEVR